MTAGDKMGPKSNMQMEAQVQDMAVSTFRGGNSTGCPEDRSNFGTYGNSGIDGDMRLSFGLLREEMCGFNYMYRTYGLMHLGHIG